VNQSGANCMRSRRQYRCGRAVLWNDGLGGHAQIAGQSRRRRWQRIRAYHIGRLLVWRNGNGRTIDSGGTGICSPIEKGAICEGSGLKEPLAVGIEATTGQ
jgi:hypothetical protein